jgi:hypothetical protein
VPAALRLEQLWNRAATRFSFSLLCGYAMSSFFNDSSAFEAVCAEHTHIMPPTRNMPAV